LKATAIIFLRAAKSTLPSSGMFFFGLFSLLDGIPDLFDCRNLDPPTADVLDSILFLLFDSGALGRDDRNCGSRFGGSTLKHVLNGGLGFGFASLFSVVDLDAAGV